MINFLRTPKLKGKSLSLLTESRVKKETICDSMRLKIFFGGSTLWLLVQFILSKETSALSHLSIACWQISVSLSETQSYKVQWKLANHNNNCVRLSQVLGGHVGYLPRALSHRLGRALSETLYPPLLVGIARYCVPFSSISICEQFY